MSYEDSIYGKSPLNASLTSRLNTAGNVGPPVPPVDDGEEQSGDDLSSLSSCNSTHPPPRPDYFGLDDTQTQSDRGEPVLRSGSLKENAPASEELPGLKFTSAAIVHKALLSNQDEQEKNPDSPAQNQWSYRSRPPSPRDDTSDRSFLQNHPPATTSMRPRQSRSSSDDAKNPGRRDDAPPGMVRKAPLPVRPLRRPTPPKRRLSSEDSFAGELPRDVERKRLMKQYTSVFDVPLSQMDDDSDPRQDGPEAKEQAHEDDNSQQESLVDEPSAYKTKHEPGGQPKTQGQESQESRASEPSAYRPTPLGPPQQQERASPTIESQETSQQLSETELSESVRMTPSQWRNSFPDGQAVGSDDAPFEPTQPTAATMWSSHPTNRSSGAGTTGVRRSLIPESKRWKYPTNPPPRIPSPPIAEHPMLNDDEADGAGSFEYEATQPSTSVNMAATGALLANTQPSRNGAASTSSMSLDVPLRESAVRHVFDTSDDIVPDSEATPLAHPSLSPEIPLPPTLPGSREKSRTVNAQSSLHSDDIVPDSLEMHEGDKRVGCESDEESEVPLAASKKEGRIQLQAKKAPASRDRGKLAKPVVASPQSIMAVDDEPLTPLPGPSKGKGRAVPQSKTKRAESEIVPSSHPNDDVPLPSAPAGKKKKGAVAAKQKKGKNLAASKAPTLTEATPVTPVPVARALRPRSTAGGSRRNYRESDDDDDGAGSDREGSAAPTVPRSDDASTFEAINTDTPARAKGIASTSRKRKRTMSESVKSTKSLRAGSRLPVRGTPDAKRQKLSSLAEPLRVFALWEDDNLYYPGWIKGPPTTAGNYNVSFDDGCAATVNILNMCKGELRPGDPILVGGDGARGAKMATVKDASRLPQGDIVVIFDDETESVVETNMIKLASRTVSTWTDRALDEEAITNAQSPPKLFSKTAFVLTFAPEKGVDFEAKKRELTEVIESRGGMVIEDWQHLFTLRGNHLSNPTRWEIEQSDVELAQEMIQQVSRVFLLSSEASSKPRYLIALALGIPCLDLEWLHDAVTKGVGDWHRFLLPAGLAPGIGPKDRVRVSQLVDLDWGNTPVQVQQIMTNPVPAKPFTGMTVLCVSPDFVPKKGKDTEMIPRIVLCMGAKKVVVVAKARSASLDFSEYKFIVVKDIEKDSLRLPPGKVVTVPWIKDCLFSSRLLPLPNAEQK